MSKFLSCALVILSCYSALAQTGSCSQTLRLARSIYESGRLHELPALLEPCLRSGFEQQDRIDAYRLLTLAYIYLEEPELADETMLKLLQTENEYRVNEDVDPAELVALYNTFRTTPIYRIGVKAGSNTTQPFVKSATPIADGTQEYSYKFGFQGGVSAEIPVNKKFVLNPGIFFQIKSFGYTDLILKDNIQTESPETHNWISVPLLVQYQLDEGKNLYNPGKPNFYLSAGVETGYLFRAEITPTTLQNEASPVPPTTYRIEQQLNRLNISAVVAAGVKFKIGKGYLVSEAAFSWGFVEIASPENTYTNQAALFGNKYIPGNYSLNTVSLSVGYLLNIYKPKKLVQ